MNTPTWVEDLFGGRDKVNYDKNGNEIRISQDTDSWAENEARGGKGDYPHYTHNYKGNQSWHYSSDQKTHSDSWSLGDDNSDNSDSES